MLSKRNKYLFTPLLIIVLLLFGEAQAAYSNKWVSEQTKVSNDALEAENFDLFLEKFNTDDAFQLLRVKFPFKVIETPDVGDTRALEHVVSRKKWKPLKLLPGGEILIKKHRIDKNTMNVKLRVKDTGVLVNHYFKCINGKWWLDHAVDLSD